MTGATGGRVGQAGDVVLRLVAGCILFGMMALTFVDVIMRYAFASSIRGAFELTEMMMVVLIFAGLPLVSRADEHVVVDLFDKFYPAPVKRALSIAAHVVCAAVLVGMAWLLWRKAERVVGDGDVTAALRIPISPFVYLMFALTVVTALIHLRKVLAALRAAFPVARRGQGE